MSGHLENTHLRAPRSHSDIGAMSGNIAGNNFPDVLSAQSSYYPKFPLKKTKLRGRSPQANYTDRATAACRRS
jgi:hypothetical protein